MKEWVEDGWLVVEDTANRSRAYSLAEVYRKFNGNKWRKKEAKWQLKGDSHAVVTENVECSPCTRFGYTVPTRGGSYRCMRD